jgi:hypothetical protein
VLGEEKPVQSGRYERDDIGNGNRRLAATKWEQGFVLGEVVYKRYYTIFAILMIAWGL